MFILKSQITIRKIYTQWQEEGRPITAESLRNQLIIVQEQDGVKLIQEFKTHNKKIRKLVGIDYAEITIKRYECITRHLSDFIQKKYDKEDILIKNVDQSFIEEFIFYLKKDKMLAQNTVIRYIKCLKKIINNAISNKWILKDPFNGIKLKAKKINREHLTEEELMRILQKRFTIPRIEIVKDIFIFSCFTGLSFIDVKELKPYNIEIDKNGDKWISVYRKKTNNHCHIPLLDIPLQIIEKYKNYPRSLNKNRCLPVPCNQNMNSYLKEIADCCEIPKQITTHTARRTFASIVTINNNIPIERVSKMLGHSDLRMTIEYTHIFDENLKNDMDKINQIYRCAPGV